MPRQWHLETALHIMGYLKLRHNSRSTFDPSYPDIDHSNFWDCDWTDFYEGAVEAIPPNTPPPRRKVVDLCMFIDSNHAGNKQTRRSRTRFMTYTKMSLINLYSKRQFIIETSVFGAEFVAMKVGIKTLCAIWYKLRMMGIRISVALHIYGDNMLAIHNTTKSESTLKKKCNAIAYHAIRKSVAMEETLTGHIRSEDNPADLLTKIVTGHKHRHLVSLFMTSMTRILNNGQVNLNPY